MSNQPAPPWFRVTEDDHAAWVVVTALSLFIYTCLAIAAKITIRFNSVSLQSHDFVLLAGMVFWAASVGCVVASCVFGLGRHQASLDAASLAKFSKLYYASSLASLAASACSRISVCLHLSALNNFGRFRIANHTVLSFIAVASTVGILASAFQCRLPRPWAMESVAACPHRGAIYLANESITIFTDTSLTLLPVIMIWKIQMSRMLKAKIVALFSTRMLVAICTVPCITTSYDFFHKYSDTTWSATWPTIWLQISAGLSILTACIPSLKAILDSWLGHVAAAPMDPPYELTMMNGAINLRAATITTDVMVTTHPAPESVLKDPWRRPWASRGDDKTVDDKGGATWGSERSESLRGLIPR